MRLQVLSDLHVDINPGVSLALAPGADVIVVAGDVCEGAAQACDWLRSQVPASIPIVFAAGNHEFFGSTLEDERRSGRRAAAQHAIHFLDDAAVEVGGLRFIGSTLWTDFDVFGSDNRERAMDSAQVFMVDHRRVRRSDTPDATYTPQDARAEHLRSRAFLEAALRRPFEGRTVVLTHHAPHAGSIHPRYRDDLVTAAFVSDLSRLIEATGPDLWVHGHTHQSFDYRVGKTRIICNPLGYGTENPSFQPKLLIEV